MRRQRYLRASSAQSLCIFCACRLAGDLPPALSTLPRRSLHTGRTDKQQAEAVASPFVDSASQPARQQSTGFDPNSSLSRSEQEERNRLRQAREQRRRGEEDRVRAIQQAQRVRQDQQRAQQQWQEAKTREATAQEEREAQERVRARWKQNEGRDSQSVSRTQPRRTDSSRGANSGHKTLSFSVTGQPSDQTSPTPALAPESKEARRARLGQQGRSNGNPQRQDQNRSAQHGGNSEHAQPASRFAKQGVRVLKIESPTTQPTPQAKQSKQPRLDNPFASATAAPPGKMDMPTFGSASGSQAVKSRPADAGWGSGPVKRALIQYSETRPADFNDDPAASTPSEPATIQQPNAAAANSSWPQHEREFDSTKTTANTLVPTNEAQGSRFSRSNSRSQAGSHQSDAHDSISLGKQQHGHQTSMRPEDSSHSSLRGVEEDAGLPRRPASQSRPNNVPDFVATLQQAEQRKAPRQSNGQWPAFEAVPESRRSRSRSVNDRPDAGVASYNDYRRDHRGDVQQQYTPDAQYQQQHDNGPTMRFEPQRRYEAGRDSPFSEPAQHRAGPGRHVFSDTYTGYRATMLDTEDHQPAEPSFDEAQAASWQHLRRRDSVPPQAAPAPFSQQQSGHPQQEQQPLDGDWIDRSFRQHQQQRSRSLPAYLDNQKTREATRNGQSPFEARGAARLAQTKCARCQQLGHVARDCPTLKDRVCYRCGQAGHMAGQCPNPSTRGNGPFQGVRKMDVGGGGVRDYEPAVGRSDGADRPRQDNRVSALESSLRDTGRRTEPRRDTKNDDDVRQELLGRRRAIPAEVEEEPEERVLRSRKFAEKEEPVKKRGGRRRDEDEDEDAGGAERDERNARKAARKAQKAQDKVEKAEERKARRTEQGPPVNLPEFVSVATLAQQLGVRYESFVSRVERLGYDDVFPGKILNAETSGMIAMEYGFEPVFGGGEAEEVERDLRARPEPEEEDRDFLPTRPPVVTIMGHVDHGKTTLLDFLRKTRVVDGEAGGITQHIGAFSVEVAEKGGKTVTFLDTPGHAAFLAMRQRGANVTDIVILVVAADDGVKPQTIEAIRCAKTAGVPILVAVNKIDKEGADVERVKGDLARHGVVVEDFGGDVVAVPVSGKTGEGVSELVEAVVVSAEILDKRAEIDGMVEGWVLEGTTRKAGRMATVLVKRGTLRPGSIIVAGKTWSRVRSLKDQSGKVVPEIGPGMPVEVDGWRDQPVAGDEVLQAETEQKATDVVEYRREKEEQKKTAADTEAINEARRLEQERVRKEKAAEAAKRFGTEADYFESAAKLESTAQNNAETTSGHMTVPFIIKADVSGSAEAVSEYVLSISSPLITPQILQSTVGAINQSDVDLASAAQGHIIAFNLPPDEGMKGVAERVGVKVLENNVIYRVLDDVKLVLEEKLPPIISTRVMGEAEVGVSFEISVGGRKKMKIAGCKVRNGVIGKGSRAKVTRGGVKVYDGIISSLKNVKKDVQEMRKGSECGMGFDDWEGFEVGDQVQTYEEISEKRRL
ncbi:translation initiation factor IF-2 [Recurvomyces mirabilis]|uniref:Translation initiation factor IF-2, mitochondrial n=1 Tax=Recurvomyces mirabilis TaxID=574656 RepID=A0AAE0WST7_9PEZI|nr:translation initiation factor IF-2 [Recurvomyces mirabilis]KAK5159313.1 translation initiation factor IF-2 [Recurvomyces mirabilis]